MCIRDRDEFWLAPVEDCVLELLLPQAVTDITMMSSSIANIAGLIFFIMTFSFRFLPILCALGEWIMVEHPAYSGNFCYKPTTSVMEYMPGSFPARNLAASRAPLAKMALE